MVWHHADLDPKSILKSDFCCNCQGSQSLSLDFSYREQVTSYCVKKFPSLPRDPAEFKEIRKKKYSEEDTYKTDSMLMEQFVKMIEHPLRTL